VYIYVLLTYLLAILLANKITVQHQRNISWYRKLSVLQSKSIV